MSAILYPVASNADRALSEPLGRCARQSDASELARGEVEFCIQPVGPAFDSENEAMAAWAGRIDDPARGKSVPPDSRFCTLREVIADGVKRRPRQAKTVFRDGHRWAERPQLPKTVWRLSVSYWRILGAKEQAAMEQARLARRRAEAASLNAAALRAMSHQPLAPVQPQQALDIGLFEFRPPEAPHLTIPDE